MYMQCFWCLSQGINRSGINSQDIVWFFFFLLAQSSECLVSLFRPKEQKPLYSFSTVTKLPNNVKIGQIDSNLPGSAARQHYLSQSRYLPGNITRCINNQNIKYYQKGIGSFIKLQHGDFFVFCTLDFWSQIFSDCFRVDQQESDFFWR